MGNDAKKGGFGQFINHIKAIFLGFFGFVSAVVGFITLVQGKTGLVTLILLGLGGAFLWLACLYFARFWKPENDDGKTGLILPGGNDKAVKRQGKKEERRRLVRQLALAGVILVPLLVLGSLGTWMHVQSLPNDDVIILVADFDGPDGQNNRVTETILRQLRDATDDYDDVEVIALGQAVTEQAGSNQARRLAEKKKADIMIWGWYGQTSDTVPISANFELLEENEYIPDDLGDSASGAIQTFDIAELNSFSLQTRLSNEMSFLTLFTLGMADYANDNWADAIALFEDALRQTEEASERLELSIIHFYRGESYASNERPNDAIQAYNQALNIKPNDYITLNNKGNVLTNLGLLDDAIKNYDLALQIKHDYSDALSNKGAALAQLGEFDNAITAFEQALKIQPDNYILLYNKGLALARLGEARAAVKAYNKALNIKPDDHAALNNKGLVLARLGDFDNAIAAFNQALRIKPYEHSPLYNKACVYGLRNKPYKAITWLEKAIILNEDYREIAKIEPAFDSIRQNPDFQALIITTP